MNSTFLFAKIYEEKRKDISLKLFNAMNEGRIFFYFSSTNVSRETF